MMKKLTCALVVLSAVPALAQDKEKEEVVERRIIVHGGPHAPMPPMPPMPPLPPEAPLAPPTYGIPPQVAARIGLPQSLVQKVQELSFEANDALISLEAELKRAQLALERELRQPSPNEATVKELVERVGRAETAVRQNRVGLMLAIKKTLGPDYWTKLEAEMGSMGMGVMPRRVRIEKHLGGPRREERKR